MKILDCTAYRTRHNATHDANDAWSDQFCWKTLMYDEDYTHVLLDGILYEMGKWGPAAEVARVVVA